MKVEELEKIEVTTSSVETQSRNGQSGTINLIPRTLEEGFSGEAGINASTEVDIIPDMDLNYRKNRLEMRGHISFEYCHPEKLNTYTEELPLITNTAEERKTVEYLQETARVNLKYKFNEKNTFKAWLLESYGKQDDNLFKKIISSEDGTSVHGPGWHYISHQYDTVSNVDRSMLVSAKAEYEHLFKGDSKIVAFAGVESSNKNSSSEKAYPLIIDGELKYEGTVWKSGDHLLKIKPGANITFSDKGQLSNASITLYISPYFDCNYHYKDLWINATARYQIFERYKKVPGHSEYDSNENDFVGNINALWQMHPHHALRLTTSRNIIRPENHMLYPGYVFYYSTGKWILGNPDLERSSVYEVELGYITDHTWGPRSLIFNTSIGYDRANKLIEESLGSAYDKRGVPFVYATYGNSGINDIAKMNLSAIYKYDILTLSMAGNLFCNFINGKGGSDKHIYYNLSASSMLNLKDGWSVNATVQYNSKIVTMQNELGDRLLATAKVSKTFGRLSASIEIFDIFDYLTEDYSESNTSRLARMYDLYGRQVILALVYKF